MLSGIVYFEEIVENIKDVTGIENMRPLYDKIRRFVFNTENDIGAGGLIIRKKKQYTIGDGNYDGKNIIMPTDFVHEYSYGDLSAGVINGNLLSLYTKGPTEIDLYYIGYLLDNNGNPFTTRNHLEAVVFNARYRLYSAKVFLREGSGNLYQLFKQEYNDEVLASRGNDAFPTKEEWSEIGKTLNGGAFEAMTDCGLTSIYYGTEDPTQTDTTPLSQTTLTFNPLDLVAVFESSLIDVDPGTFTKVFASSITTTTTITGNLTSQ